MYWKRDDGRFEIFVDYLPYLRNKIPLRLKILWERIEKILYKFNHSTALKLVYSVLEYYGTLTQKRRKLIFYLVIQ